MRTAGARARGRASTGHPAAVATAGRERWSAGRSPQPIVVTIAVQAVNTSTGRSTVNAAGDRAPRRRGWPRAPREPGGLHAGRRPRPRRPAARLPRGTAGPAVRGRRQAPLRTATSSSRSIDRASRNCAVLTQAISSTRPTPPNSSISSGRLCADTASFSGSDVHEEAEILTVRSAPIQAPGALSRAPVEIACSSAEASCERQSPASAAPRR